MQCKNLFKSPCNCCSTLTGSSLTARQPRIVVTPPLEDSDSDQHFHFNAQINERLVIDFRLKQYDNSESADAMSDTTSSCHAYGWSRPPTPTPTRYNYLENIQHDILPPQEEDNPEVDEGISLQCSPPASPPEQQQQVSASLQLYPGQQFSKDYPSVIDSGFCADSIDSAGTISCFRERQRQQLLNSKFHVYKVVIRRSFRHWPRRTRLQVNTPYSRRQCYLPQINDLSECVESLKLSNNSLQHRRHHSSRRNGAAGSIRRTVISSGSSSVSSVSSAAAAALLDVKDTLMRFKNMTVNEESLN